jgi:hypothetical protein
MQLKIFGGVGNKDIYVVTLSQARDYTCLTYSYWHKLEHEPHDNGRRFAALKFDILINNSIGLQED